MTTTQLTPAQHAILAHAVEHTSGKIDWFPDNIKGGARKKVLDGLFNRALITTDGTDWFVAAEGYDVLGMPRPGLKKKNVGQFEAHLDQIIANAEGALADRSDHELEAAVTAAEATWTQEPTQAKPRTRDNSKQAEVIRMLQRPEGATIGQICTATGWQAHTVRGTFAGAFKKKLGLNIVSDKPQGGERVYRIA
ncbi:Uncharacterized conserved protein (phage-related) [Janthinobacterium sp. Marseille]|nr:DUF3489 domain-containing protein [Janthinobacterium sp. Marseille]ABR90649.1 Uncharacterized conserved protein (phage-related) [Janthinobacterium sp. Marseille]